MLGEKGSPLLVSNRGIVIVFGDWNYLDTKLHYYMKRAFEIRLIRSQITNYMLHTNQTSFEGTTKQFFTYTYGSISPGREFSPLSVTILVHFHAFVRPQFWSPAFFKDSGPKFRFVKPWKYPKFFRKRLKNAHFRPLLAEFPPKSEIYAMFRP